MTSVDLVNYVRLQMQDGMSAADIRIAVLEAGWSEADVDNALHDVAAGMEPLTTGASLHEDVAQVRGMVAHLATRVKTLEARLVSAGALAELPELGVGSAAPDRALPAGSHYMSTHGGVIITLLASLMFVAVGIYANIFDSYDASAQMTYGVGLSLASLALGWLFMRRRHAWIAIFLSALGVGFLGTTTLSAYSTHHFIEYQTAIGLCVFGAVIAGVMGAWSARYVRT